MYNIVRTTETETQLPLKRLPDSSESVTGWRQEVHPVKILFHCIPMDAWQLINGYSISLLLVGDFSIGDRPTT